MLDIKNNQFLNKDEIRTRANSIFTTKGAPETSEKYSHIPTEKIIKPFFTCCTITFL